MSAHALTHTHTPAPVVYIGLGVLQMGVIREALVDMVQPDVAASVREAIDVSVQ